MAKWRGDIGFSECKMIRPGIWDNDSQIIARKYVGEAIRESQLNNYSGTVNPEIKPNVQLSILADQYMFSHMSDIKYAEYGSAVWTVTSFDYIHPRVTLHLGGAYNGEKG